MKTKTFSSLCPVGRTLFYRDTTSILSHILPILRLAYSIRKNSNICLGSISVGETFTCSSPTLGRWQLFSLLSLSIHRIALLWQTRVANWQCSNHIITKARFLFCSLNFLFSSRILPVQHNNLLLCQSAVSVPLCFTLIHPLGHLDAPSAIRICKRLTLNFSFPTQICSVSRLQPRRRLRLSDLQS